MDHDERYTMNEQARAEFLYPSAFGKVIYCQNCHEPIHDETAIFNDHIVVLELKMKIKQVYCIECISEVIAYRYKMRNVSQMTKELKS